MATRSSITVKSVSGKYRGVYCHNDGYPSYNGNILLKYYNSQALAEALVDLGHLSVLAPEFTKPRGHSFDNPTEGHVVAYHRDRGEKKGIVTGRTWESVVNKIDCQYSYLFEDGMWFVSGEDFTRIPLIRFIKDGVMQDDYE